MSNPKVRADIELRGDYRIGDHADGVVEQAAAYAAAYARGGDQHLRRRCKLMAPRWSLTPATKKSPGRDAFPDRASSRRGCLSRVRQTRVKSHPFSPRQSGPWSKTVSRCSYTCAVSSGPVRSEVELSGEDRARLDSAYSRLREAAKAYEPYLARQLAPDGTLVVHDFDEMANAQAAVEAAERELWQLREEVLGWSRPPWAPSATSVAEWFSDEDSAFDE